MKRTLISFFLTGVILFASGCLTVEKKEYSFRINKDNSGTLTIKFVNIMSSMDEEQDVSETDYTELIDNYMNGSEMEDTYPNAVLESKRLFEENNQLCGEVVFSFSDYREAKLFMYSKNAPLMYSLCGFLDSEAYFTSNGEFGGEDMPVVFWDNDLSELKLVTKITEPDETTVSLLTQYLNNN